MPRPTAVALFVLLAPLASADVITVGPPSRNADHSGLQDAIDAAQDGDVIHVFPMDDPLDRYGGFVIDGKSLTIRGEGRPHTLTGAGIVRSIPLGKSVLLDGIDMNYRSFPLDAYWGYQGGNFPGLTISECQGAVRLVECSGEGNRWHRNYAGLQLVDALDVVAVDCTFIGAGGFRDLPESAAGIQAVSSRFALFGCEVYGGDNLDFSISRGGNGGAGITMVLRSVLWIVDSYVEGGDGSDTFCSACPDFPGDGGDGIDVQQGSICFESDSVFVGGAGSIGTQHGEVDGEPGVPIVGLVQSTPGVTVPFECTRAVRDGAPLRVSVEGTPGDEVSLALANGGGFRFLGGDRGALLVSDFVTGGFVDLGPIPASGRLEVQVPLPSVDATGADGFLAQVSVRDATGHFRLSSALTVSVFGADVPDLDFDRRIVFVNASAPPGGDGYTWDTAFDTLEEATLHTPWNPVGGTIDIWVAEGTYHAEDASIGNGARLLGGFAGNETSADQADPMAHPTILDGDPQGDGFGSPNNNLGIPFQAGDTRWGWWADDVVVRGFRFTRYSHGGMRLAGRAVVSDCQFVNVRGPSLISHVRGDLLVEHCDFRPNRYVDAHGIQSITRSGASITVRECSFLQVSRLAVRVSPFLFSDPSPEVEDLTIDGCTFVSDSGTPIGLRGVERTTIRNCIFHQTAPDSIGGPVYSTQPVTQLAVEHSCVNLMSPDAPGPGNVFADPGFANLAGPNGTIGNLDDAFDLGPSSPCIDAGNSLFVPSHITTDLAGNPRIVDDPAVPDTGVPAPGGAVVDMGALERQ